MLRKTNDISVNCSQAGSSRISNASDERGLKLCCAYLDVQLEAAPYGEDYLANIP
jgi:hypothetical protein